MGKIKPFHYTTLYTDERGFAASVVNESGTSELRFSVDVMAWPLVDFSDAIDAPSIEELPRALVHHKGKKPNEALLQDMADAVAGCLDQVFPSGGLYAIREKINGKPGVMRLTFSVDEPNEMSHLEALFKEAGLKVDYRDNVKPEPRRDEDIMLPQSLESLITALNNKAKDASRFTAEALRSFFTGGSERGL